MKRQTIPQFIAEQAGSRVSRSLYFQSGKVVVYLRAGPYHWEGDERHLALGIANVSVPPKFQRQGRFRRLLNTLESKGKALGYKVIRVEQVIDEHLLAALKRYGYTVQDPNEHLPVLVRWIAE